MAKARLDEAVVLDEDAMKANELIDHQGEPPGLKDCSRPAIEATPGRPLAFDLEAGLTVRQKKEAGCTRHQLLADSANRLFGFGPQGLSDQPVQEGRSPQRRAKLRRSQKIVSHPMTAREGAGQGVITLRIKEIHGRDAGGVGNIQRSARQELVEKPSPPIWRSRWQGAHEIRRDRLGNRKEETLKDQEIEVLMAQGEG
ncbi:hypothetical protein D3C87_1566500 [compost metagenome]